MALSADMSWQAYIDTSLLGSGKVSKAAILGHDGNVWAASAGFQPRPQEGVQLLHAFKDASGIRSAGLHIAGQKVPGTWWRRQPWQHGCT